jgi:hypothetical protein
MDAQPAGPDLAADLSEGARDGRSTAMNRLVGVTVDCVDIDRAAQFWASALDGAMIVDQSPRSRVLDVPVGDQQLRLTFRRVGSAKVTTNRLRLCLRASDLYTETARLLSIGAIRLASGNDAAGWALLADIEGNEIDLVGLGDWGL